MKGLIIFALVVGAAAQTNNNQQINLELTGKTCQKLVVNLVDCDMTQEPPKCKKVHVYYSPPSCPEVQIVKQGEGSNAQAIRSDSGQGNKEGRVSQRSGKDCGQNIQLETPQPSRDSKQQVGGGE